jgi:uncharacterized integral membrane protein
MINRLSIVLVVLPVAIILIALSVANRAPATFSYDPFASGNAGLSVTVPLFVLLFGAFIAGVLIGGMATWFGQRKYRKAVRRSEAEAGALRAKLQGAGTNASKDMAATGLAALTR